MKGSKRKKMGKSLSDRFRIIKRDSIALYLACRDARTPFYVKIIAFIVVAYALSPIDLIPDFIPVLGLLDDAVLLPLGLYVAFKLLPDDIARDCREKADSISRKPRLAAGAILVICVWIISAFAVAYIIQKAVRS